MAPQIPSGGGASPVAGSAAGVGYKRASRAKAPKRFTCGAPGCDKIYSRAEHLQRHQLNHNPKEIFRCDVDGCAQKFVRSDLLERHKKRHTSTSYIPRNRLPSFSTAKPDDSSPSSATAVVSPSSAVEPRSGTFSNAPHDAAILLTPDSATHPQPQPQSHPQSHSQPHPHPQPSVSGPAPPRQSQSSNWPAAIPDMNAVNIIRPKPTYYPPRDVPAIVEQPSVMAFSNAQFQPDEASRDNFAMWLFNPATQYGDLGVASGLPFFEGGLESAFNSNIHYDYESLTSGRSQLETPPRMMESSDELLSEFRRQEVLRWFQAFRQKNPRSEPLIVSLVHDSGGDLPALNLEMMRDCLQEYWDNVSPRLPIVHQPTFSCNRCSIFLLLVMIALGAASLRSRDTSGNLSDYGAFADVIIWPVRWEIMTSEEASPPVSLSVAQALLLVEFYEKMYSSRPLHERANIYHSVVLNLLRRGSPLIGRAGNDTPPEEADNSSHGVALDSRTWWIRWAETEAMHRVVFGAFMLDIIHAAMFGHASDMAPHEIRLSLPCDDNQWGAISAEAVRQLDQNFRMYGVKTLSFLDGLKRALHGKEVRTHSFGRMIILCGLLSVGWQLSRRETHTKWLDLNTASTETQDNWKRMLLKAFDDWKSSFDLAQGTMGSPTSIDASGQRTCSNGPIQSASVLYHLAHISLHVDIVDCQVYAGAKRLLGRRVSTRDYTNVVSRMRIWASLPLTRHAVLHAFKLLHRVLVDPRRNFERKRPQGANGIHPPPPETQPYSCRNESDPHRPWIMYYAALTIWSFVRAIGRHDSLPSSEFHAPQMLPTPRPSKSNQGPPPSVNYRRVVSYLSNVASLPELTEQAAATLAEGLPDLLDTLHAIFAESQSELLREAHERLRLCRDFLVAPPG